MLKIRTWLKAVIILLLLGWLGLQIKPRPFPVLRRRSSPPEMVPLPAGLPGPVERFYRRIYGEHVPLIESVVVSGRAGLRVGGIAFPGRFRITHDAGRGYRHYIEATFLGFPLLKINEYYLAGQARLELPFGVTEDAPKVDQGANLALWAESLFWAPAILVTDPRVRWEPIDDHTALLVIPFAEQEERLVVRFAPETGLPHFIEAMRYRDPADAAKTLWIVESLGWHPVEDHPVSAATTLTWFDQGRPWARFEVEEAVYNVEVQEYIRARGP